MSTDKLDHVPIGRTLFAQNPHHRANDMHRALAIPEIERMICAYLSEDPSSLAVLARTGTVFHDPALDTLWNTQTSLKPLLGCIPKNLFDFQVRDRLAPRFPPWVRDSTHCVFVLTRDVGSAPTDYERRLGTSHIICCSNQKIERWI